MSGQRSQELKAEELKNLINRFQDDAKVWIETNGIYARLVVGEDEHNGTAISFGTLRNFDSEEE